MDTHAPFHTAEPGFGLYVHWPFCIRRCPYCDFNAYVAATAVDHERWRQALRRALRHAVAHAPGRILTSVFFGGGTPSLMEPATVATVLDQAAVYWSLADDVEVTLEANPGTLDGNRCQGFRSAGVNRLSLGVQALDDESLRRLGRIHNASQAMVAIDIARRFFPRLSFDLIYARPSQTLTSWQRELERAVALATDHLSLYQLAIEPGTSFFANQNTLMLPDENAAADLYQLTQVVTAAAGLPAYEISNHARRGAEGRHNLTYWRGGDSIGIGPGAHGRLTGRDGVTMATCQYRAPEVWLARAEAGDYGTLSFLSPEERVEELLLMGLRLTAGVDRTLFHRLAGRSLEGVLNPHVLARLDGFVVLDEGGLRATAAGRLVLNEILRQLDTSGNFFFPHGEGKKGFSEVSWSGMIPDRPRESGRLAPPPAEEHAHASNTPKERDLI